MPHSLIDDLLQVAYWLRVRLEPSAGCNSVRLSTGLNIDTEHWFEGGIKHDVFLRYPNPDIGSIEVLHGEHIEVEVVVHCWSHQPVIEVGAKWITYAGYTGSVAQWQVLTVLHLWEEKNGSPHPIREELGRHSKV